MTKVVNIHEAKTHLSRLVEEVQDGESVVIARAGRPLAEFRRYAPADLVFGGLAGMLEYADAFTPEADAEVAGLFDAELELPGAPDRAAR